MIDPTIKPTGGEHSDILLVLLSQHHHLRKYLASIKGKIATSSPDFAGIVADLKSFQDVLTVHLKLEDEEFYPQIIETLEEKQVDTKSIREFIAKMKEIGGKVYHFLEQYDAIQKIEEDFIQFQKNFDYIEGLLLLRISTEEESVYLYWEL